MGQLLRFRTDEFNEAPADDPEADQKYTHFNWPPAASAANQYSPRSSWASWTEKWQHQGLSDHARSIRKQSLQIGLSSRAPDPSSAPPRPRHLPVPRIFLRESPSTSGLRGSAHPKQWTRILRTP